VDIYAACRHLVQQGLPHMSTTVIDKGYDCAVSPGETLAEARRELEPAGPAPHHYDVMRVTHGFDATAPRAGSGDPL
jgi:hypothetical protein